MRVDFYQLSRDPAPATAAVLAGKVMGAGERLLVIANDADLLKATSKALWEASDDSFLANAMAGGAHDARQPVLLSHDVAAANGATMLLIADGQWRDPGNSFKRVMFLFDQETIDGARSTWRTLGDAEGTERHFWKQDGGRWVEGP